MIRELSLKHIGALAFDSPATKVMDRLIQRIAHGTLIVSYPGGRTTRVERDDQMTAALDIHRPRRLLKRLALRGTVGLAEGYMDGDWETPDLPALLTLLARNEAAILGNPYGTPLALLDRVRHQFNKNNRRGSRRNIAYHYDLGNDFYRLWLDAGMSYSAALFRRKDRQASEPLEDAQDRKYQRLLDECGAKAGEHILEVGCGWGGFAEYAARRGIRVTGITLSREQHDYAIARLAAAGLSDLSKIRLQDYRDVQGSFDHIISIEMMEAVGESYWQTYFDKLSSCLKPGGTLGLQVITIDEAIFPLYRQTPDFIQLYVFPGGMLPTRTHLADLGRSSGLEAGNEKRYGADYAGTCRNWLARFNNNSSKLDALGYDASFLRRWRFYLSYCIAGFSIGSIDVIQRFYSKPAV
ncbi:cyclopropane-fatty-acyl-phospholipid synthase family protein [Granulosicoccaceae sp. 1_MG-2023]|nr:cyclopropane-fatty-acyl-phospholipid synthase family protein [Granulosicoccaceae sp. 1_MG-2023]